MSHKKIIRQWSIADSDITDESIYHERRKFIKDMGFLGMGALISSSMMGCDFGASSSLDQQVQPDYSDRFGLSGSTNISDYPTISKRWGVTPEEFSQYNPTERELTNSNYALSYNNFYEFTTRKSEVHTLVHDFIPDPWMITVVDVDGTILLELDLDDIIKLAPLETRVYRMRCVEAWAMTVPWIGYSLKALIEKANPSSKATHVRFVSFDKPEQAVGQRSSRYQQFFPYYEGLRMDEAMHDLTLLTVGIYDSILPKQHGAPARIIVPWKYGYKSPKSVVRIEFVEEQPGTFWNDLNPSAYGFYSNVDPHSSTVNWSQARERLLSPQGESVDTQKYNGYEEWVGGLYT